MTDAQPKVEITDGILRHQKKRLAISTHIWNMASIMLKLKGC
jgi:hypothetical protein